MSRRGKPPNLRPITPPKPTLTARPVPRTRHFAIQSFGAGAAPNILTTTRRLKDLDAKADATKYQPAGLETYYRLGDETRKLLEEVERYETARTHLPPAIDFLVTATQRDCRRYTLPVYDEEAAKRFKLDVIQDEVVLDAASDDRIRKEFRAFLRGLRVIDDEDRIRGPARNSACIVLDEENIAALAGLRLPDDDLVRDFGVVGEKNTVKLVDFYWERAGTNEWSYRGTGRCSVIGLRGCIICLLGGIFRGLLLFGCVCVDGRGSCGCLG